MSPGAFTVQQAADYLQLSKDTVYTLCREGRLPHRRLGRSIRIPKAALDTLLLHGDTTGLAS